MPAIPRRFRLRDLLVALLVVSILSAVGIQIFAARRWEARQVGCASNLRAIWGCAFNYAAQHGGPERNMHSDTGAAFFMRLQSPAAPDRPRIVTFFCPIAGDPARPGATSYRGPAADVNTMDDKDPVAADKEGNHGRGFGGNILFRMGEIRSYEESDPLWSRARETTKE